MAKKQKPTSHRRTREELVIDTFRCMIRNGEAVRKEVVYPNRFGGIESKEIYKIKTNRRK